MTTMPVTGPALSLSRICVAGAGAIGGVLAARLAAAGHTVNVLARGSTLEVLRCQGVRLEDLKGSVRARVTATDQPVFGPQDLIFVCTKSQDLLPMLEQVTPLLHPGTIVVPAVNGVPWWYFHKEGGRFDGQAVQSVDPGNRLPDLVPFEHVLGCVVFITAEVLAPGVIRSATPHLMMLGEPSGEMSERLRAVAALLEGAGIEARTTEHIRDKLWTKLIANLTSNPLSVLTHATLEQLYGDPELSAVVRLVLREVLLVAASYGARIAIDPETFLQEGEAMGPFRTSMLQDHARGRPLELAAIGEAVLELADRYGLPMPTTRAIVSLARFCGRARNSSIPSIPPSLPLTESA